MSRRLRPTSRGSRETGFVQPPFAAVKNPMAPLEPISSDQV
jgi:hypothetical protein